jgi:hypothetical protein
VPTLAGLLFSRQSPSEIVRPIRIRLSQETFSARK